MSEPVRLIDLSNNNATPDFHQVAAAGIAGVWLKVTEGIAFVDETYSIRRHAATAAGLRVGGYHFFHPASSPEQQAQFFANHLGPIGPHDLRPALDCEATDDEPAATIVDCARRFNHELRNRTNVGPLFYTFTSFARQLAADKPIGYGLWLADYGPDNGAEHPASAPPPWRRYVAHQYTSKGTVPGCHGPVDISTAADLRPLLAHPPPLV